jgi:cytochrome P450
VLTPEQVATIEDGAAGLRSYVEAVIERRRLEPGDDLVTRLLEAEVDGERLSADDVVAMTSGFAFAGAETTRRQLTAAILVFAEQPEAWERLAAAPDLVPAAVEEVLRHRPRSPSASTSSAPTRAATDLRLGPALLCRGRARSYGAA